MAHFRFLSAVHFTPFSPHPSFSSQSYAFALTFFNPTKVIPRLSLFVCFFLQKIAIDLISSTRDVGALGNWWSVFFGIYCLWFTCHTHFAINFLRYIFVSVWFDMLLVCAAVRNINDFSLWLFCMMFCNAKLTVRIHFDVYALISLKFKDIYFIRLWVMRQHKHKTPRTYHRHL